MEELVDSLKALDIEVDSLETMGSVGEKQIYYFTCVGSAAVDYWRKIRGALDKTGFYPVILGDPEELDNYDLEGEDLDEETHPLLEEANSLDMEKWFNYKLEELNSWDEEFELPRGDFPDKPPATSNTFTIPTDITTGEFLPEVVIALVPTRNGWEVPAYLEWGGWNECPDPVEHVAVLKLWHEQYGAALVGLSSDTLELEVSKQPASRDEAIALATRQYAYCPDIVEQGVGTIEELAAGLMVTKTWFFWWD